MQSDDMKAKRPTPLSVRAARISSAISWRRLAIGTVVGLATMFAVSAFLPVVLWTCFFYVGHFWQIYLAPGTIPEYKGISLGLSGKFVDELAFGYYDTCPSDYFILVENEPKQLADLKTEDVTILGMTPKVTAIFGDMGYELGNLPSMSFAEFKNGRLITFLARHGDFKFSKAPDGPFFSLPISFDEYKKMFGKPIRWRREKSARTVP